MAEAPPTPIKQQDGPPHTDTSEQLNILSARLRVGEERYNEMRKKVLVIEQNMLSNHKRAMTEVKNLQTEMNEIKRTIQSVEDKIITVVKELRLTARKEDIDILKRYLELWDPVKFITAENVEKIIDEKLGRHEEENHEQTDTRVDKPVNYDSPS